MNFKTFLRIMDIACITLKDMFMCTVTNSMYVIYSWNSPMFLCDPTGVYIPTGLNRFQLFNSKSLAAFSEGRSQNKAEIKFQNLEKP